MSSAPELVLRKVSYTAIRVGEALPWPVYDARGQLLLEKGYVVETEKQIEVLISRGLCLTEVDAQALDAEKAAEYAEYPRINPFAHFKGMLADLREIYEEVGAKSPESPDLIDALVERIRFLGDSDPDGCLALIHIYSVEPSPVEQSAFYGLLGYLMARRLGYSQSGCDRVVAAALTANMTLVPYQEKLNNSNMALTDKLREIINKHPSLAVAALQQAGINDSKWLQIIEQHHEKVDGSGYPKGLSGTAILPEARLLALLERYIAMVTVRAYRRRYRPDEALREILLDAGEERTTPLYDALARVITRFPPGTFVRLKNGECALVIRRESGDQPMKMMAVFAAGGIPYRGAFERDPRNSDYTIAGPFVPEYMPLLDLSALWGY